MRNSLIFFFSFENSKCLTVLSDLCFFVLDMFGLQLPKPLHAISSQSGSDISVPCQVFFRPSELALLDNEQ